MDLAEVKKESKLEKEKPSLYGPHVQTQRTGSNPNYELNLTSQKKDALDAAQVPLSN